MNYEQMLFTNLSEECAEAIQACSKIIRFGIDSDFTGISNRDQLTKELNDIMAVIELLRIKGVYDYSASDNKEEIELAINKIEKFNRLSEYSGFIRS